MDYPGNDPIDHHRTTRPRAGEALKYGPNAPGLVGVALGVVALIGGLFAVASGHATAGTVAVILAVVLDVAGVAWLLYTHRRVREIQLRWEAEHSDEPVSGRERL